MVLPDAVDAQILPGIAFAGESRLLQQPHGGRIGGNACGFDAVQAQGAEREGQQGAHRRRHMAAPGVRLAHPISEAPRLRDAAAHVGQSEAAQQHLIAAAENEERIRLIAALVFGVAAQTAPERRAREIVGGPDRLPRSEERAARFAQGRPFGVVARSRSAQHHTASLDNGQRIGKIGGAEECHGWSSGRVPVLDRGDSARSYATWRPRLSAIAAALSSPAGPSAANAGGLRRISSRPAARALSTVTASSLAMISSIASGRPWAKICRASCSARALELSSAINSPAFICALARSTSLASRSSAAAATWSTTTRISSEASAASVPA